MKHARNKDTKKKPIRSTRFNSWQLLVFVFVFGVIGILVWRTFAATPPSAPTLTSASVTYTSGTNTTSYIVLTWTTPSAGTSPITKYKIYRGTAPNGESANAIATVGPYNNYTDNPGFTGTSYYYKVTAVSADGESAQSNELSATTGFFTAGYVQLDNGTCSQNLQIGSDTLASHVANPTFLLGGDGGAASYSIKIDGNSIGTFNSDGFGHVCINAPSNLSDGYHQLTGTENSPHNTYTVAPLSFLVDTVPPVSPSAPALNNGVDTGASATDNITKFKNVGMNGTTTEPSTVSVTLYNGVVGVGGSSVDHTTGAWAASTTPLSDGSYSFQATGSDEAGNISSRSAALNVTVDSTAPSGSITAPATGGTVSGTTTITASASDNLSGVWKVDFLVDGVTKSTDTTSPYSYSWDTSSLANGSSHTLTAIVYDIAGNTFTTPASTVTVQAGSASAPSAPTITSIVPGATSINLQWSTPSNGGSPITSYNIYRGTSSGTEGLLTNVPSSSNALGDNNLTSGTTYYYQVSAVNSVGEGARSTEASATTTSSVPGDLNGDGHVNITDLSILLSNYGTSNAVADINHDGTVNILDLSILLSHYGV